MSAGEPPTLIRRQIRAVVALLVIAGGVLGVAYGVYRLTVGRPMLAGQRSHDFGTVELVDNAVDLQHTFVLTNRSRRTIEIANVKTSCGCTAADPSTRTLPPGASVEIAATLTLKDDVRKKASIYLDYGAEDVDVLHLEAFARLRHRLKAAPGPDRLEPGETIDRLIFYLDYDSNDAPPAPRITTPPGVRAEINEWAKVAGRRPSTGSAARWRSRLRLELTNGPPATDGDVLIEVGPDQKLTIPLELRAASSGG